MWTSTSAALPISWSLVLLMSLPCFARVGAFREEPFDSFRRLDSQLSVLQNQFTEVRRGLQMGGPAETKQWLNAVHASSQTTLSIQAIARKLTARYRHRRERFGVKVFGRLELRAS